MRRGAAEMTLDVYGHLFDRGRAGSIQVVEKTILHISTHSGVRQRQAMTAFFSEKRGITNGASGTPAELFLAGVHIISLKTMAQLLALRPLR